MEEKGYRKFALTGSSARKLRRGQANLLAGRAVLRNLHPLTSLETGFTVPAAQLLRYGCLPIGITAAEDELREDFLRAYVTVYLSEEVKAESLVRNLGSFSRFLEIAALAAGRTTNLSNIARETGISRDTVRGYFDVLVDTLIGSWLPAYRPRARIKEVSHPKFYWFDPGVLHAAAGGFDQPLPADWHGVLLEHLVFHEIKSHLEYSRVRGSLGYWGTPGGNEVDFVWWHGDRVVGIEVKHSRQFRREDRRGLEALQALGAIERYVVYRGDRELNVDGIRVLPLEEFLARLHRGEIIG